MLVNRRYNKPTYCAVGERDSIQRVGDVTFSSAERYSITLEVVVKAFLSKFMMWIRLSMTILKSESGR